MAKVLIIDDDQAVCRMLSTVVKKMGHTAEYETTMKGGFEKATAGAWDVVLLDVRMPDGSGLEILPAIKNTPSSPEVIIMTGFGDPDGAETAIRNGAWDYVEKPVFPEKITPPLQDVLKYREYLEKTQKVRKPLKLEGIVGSNAKMKACYDTVAQAAESDVNILITGETGVGKELFARAVHMNSRRAPKGFVIVDCAALPETLVESALFGYQKGAFTGADKNRDGLVRQADGGTLFLDEIGELPLSTQKTFLRFLQERSFRPVGGGQEVTSDFRLVAATNRDLDSLVKRGLFREDLLYRLRTLTLNVPPLRERCDDIEALVSYHTAAACRRFNMPAKTYSPEFYDALGAYEWPGNVRELFNTLDGVFAETPLESAIFPKRLPSRIRVSVARASVSRRYGDESGEPVENRSHPPAGQPKPLREYRDAVLAEAETKYLQELMEYTTGCVKDACRIAGVSRTTLYNMMKKYGVSRYGWHRR